MTKDPYTPLSRLISQAVESVATKEECCPTLISPQAVKVQTFNIQHAPRSSRQYR